MPLPFPLAGEGAGMGGFLGAAAVRRRMCVLCPLSLGTTPIPGPSPVEGEGRSETVRSRG